MKKQIIIAGASANSATFINRVSFEFGDVVCFIDKNPLKQGCSLAGYKILSYKDAIKEFPDACFYVGGGYLSEFSIYNDLINLGIPRYKILNISCEIKKRRFCKWLESCFILKDRDVFCCYQLPPQRFYMPVVSEHKIQELFEFRDDMRIRIEQKTEMGTVCENCCHIEEGKYFKHSPTLAVSTCSGSVCNLSCYHCVIKYILDYNNNLQDFEINNLSERNTAIISLLKNYKKDVKNWEMSVGNGEITLNPQENELFDVLRNMNTDILTNATILSQRIMDKLKNRDSYVHISLDSGTKETYKKLKGADMFDIVISNIREYSKHGFVKLKYIFFEGINDNKRDVDGFIELIESIDNVIEVGLSADLHCLIDKSDRLIDLIVYFSKQLATKKIPSQVMYAYFTGNDKNRIEKGLENYEN